VALRSIGKEFDASQIALNLVAVGYSLGLQLRFSTSALSATATGASSCSFSAWC